MPDRCSTNRSSIKIAGGRVKKAILLVLWVSCFGRIMPAAADVKSPTTSASRPSSVIENAAEAKGLDQALERLHAPMRQSPPRSPQEELKRFHSRPGLAVDLIASEPVVRQPLCIN